MSKQSEAKQAQGFEPKKKWPVCGNCAKFTFDTVEKVLYGLYVAETNLRCSVGNFKVGKSDTCKLHEAPHA